MTFFGVLFLIFSPIFGDGKNGLVYSDDMFNKLSKGSSYFIPKVAKSNEKFNTTDIAMVVKLDKPEQNDQTIKILAAAGAEAQDREPRDPDQREPGLALVQGTAGLRRHVQERRQEGRRSLRSRRKGSHGLLVERPKGHGQGAEEAGQDRRSEDGLRRHEKSGRAGLQLLQDRSTAASQKRPAS